MNFAGEGMPLHLWRALAAPGAAEEDVWAIGRARQAKKIETDEIYVVDEGAGAIAGLTGYAIGAEPTPIGPDFPAMARPLQELENLAPSSWYVNVLAAYPEHRGKGWGARLLALGETIAAERGLERMSIIVADRNAGARRLYERVGYRETARRPIATDGWECDSSEWVLMLKPIA